MKHSSGKSQRQCLMALCCILGITLTIMLTVTVFYGIPLKAEAQSHISSVAEPDEASQAVFAFAPVQLSTRSEAPAIGGRGSGLINILLIGQDRREGEQCSRADTILLCSFQKDAKTITMTSFLRDLYLPIPGHGENRINASYAFGGTSLLKQTMEENFGLYLDGCVEVDFSQFAQIVDILGGVTLDLRQDEADAINKAVPGSLTEGSQWLSGPQALAYTRIRNLDEDGDFSRTARQRNVIRALIGGYRDSDPLQALSVLSKILPMLSTDMENSEIVSTILQILPMLSGSTVVSQRIPADGMYSYRTIEGMSVISADLSKARSLLKETLTNSA